MRRPDGYSTIVGDFRATDVKIIDRLTGLSFTGAEVDTFQCGHCQRTVHVPPRADPASIGGGCRICQRNICPQCVAKGTCDPFEEKIARQERLAEYERLSKL